MAKKVIFRFMRGRLRKLTVSDMSLAGVHHSNKQLQNMKTARTAFSKFRKSPTAISALFRKGGPKDPLRIAADNAIVAKNNAAESLAKFNKKIKGMNDIEKQKFKNARKKVRGIFGDVEDIMRGPQKAPVGFSREQIKKLSKRPASKEDFLELLSDNPKISNSFIGDAAEVLGDPVRGATGPRAIGIFKNTRRRSAKRLQSEINKQLPGPDKIDVKVSRRGKAAKNLSAAFKRAKRRKK